ncbi:MAG TPA: TonB-dependent receptor [Bacteroidia bacterium]|nr:TonB-dependent receptor [Bacteroidia bacterium]
MKTIKHYIAAIAVITLSGQFAQAQDTAKGSLNDTNHLNAVHVLAVRQAQSLVTLTTEDLNRASGLKLQDALNLVPGVDFQNREPWGGVHIIIRGYIPNLGSPANLSINTGSGYGYMAYINNIPITDATGNTIMDDIDVSTLGQVQIIKGPASSLYGSYIGGSVHLFTPVVAPGTTTIQEQVVGGSYGLFRDNTTITTATDKSSIWVNYGGQTYDGFRPNDASRKQFASFAGDFKTSDKNTISTYFSYNYSYEGLSGELDSDQVYGRKAVGDTNYDRNNSMVQIEGVRGGVTDKYKICSGLTNEATVFLTTRSISQVIAHGFTDYQEGDFGGRDAFNFHKGIVDAVLGASFQKINETVNGYSVNHDSLAPFHPLSGTGSDQQNFALNYNLFTQWGFKLPSNITVMVGGSMNFSEFYIQNMLNGSHAFINNPPTFGGSVTPAFTPSGSVIKVFNENVSAYVSVGMGYTPPSLSNMVESNNTIDVGLKPESAIQYEIGTKGNLANGKLQYQLALYDLDITNRLIQEYANGIGFYTNAGEQRNTGVELFLAYDLINSKDGAISLVRPWVSYTYDNAEYVTFNTYNADKKTNSDTVAASYSGNKVAGVAPNMLNAGIDFATKMGFYVHVTYQYMDKVPFTFDNEHYMSSYSLLNGRLGYKHTFGHLSADVFVGVDNALSQTYYTSVFFAANIQDLAQGSDANYFNPAKSNRGTGGDGYILPAPYNATFYGGVTLKYTF